MVCVLSTKKEGTTSDGGTTSVTTSEPSPTPVSDLSSQDSCRGPSTLSSGGEHAIRSKNFGNVTKGPKKTRIEDSERREKTNFWGPTDSSNFPLPYSYHVYFS